MAKIVKNIETTHFYQHKNEPIEKDYNCIDERFITNRVCLAAVRIAKTTNVSAIVTLRIQDIQLSSLQHTDPILTSSYTVVTRE
jgi:pyruvate kinase